MKLQRLLLRYYPPGMYIYNKSTIAVKWICKSCHYWCCGLALYGMGSHACTADPCSSTCVAGIVMHDFIHVKKKGVRMGYMMGVHEVLSELTILIATVIMVACTSMSAGQCDWRMGNRSIRPTVVQPRVLQPQIVQLRSIRPKCQVVQPHIP